MNTLKTFSPRTVPGYVSVLGSAKTNATVSLWSTNSTSLYATTTRKGEYFHGELPLNNSTGAVWLTLTNLAVLQNGGNPDIVTNTIGQTFVAQTPEAFYYDLDGNLTNDGRWIYTWDAENRLVRMESSSAAPSPSKCKLEFAYDAKGRRIQKLVSTNNGSSYVAQYTNRFIYDGWNLVGVLSPNSSLLSGVQRHFSALAVPGLPRKALHPPRPTGDALSMSRTILAVVVCLPMLLMTSGCYTTVAVNFGNGTPAKVRVQSSQTGQEIEVAPDKFKKLPHSSGDLIVTTEANEKFKFQQVAPFDVDRNYHTIGHSIFGPNSVTLNVRLETNMQVYVVMPGKKVVDGSIAQPNGYPKTGEKLSN